MIIDRYMYGPLPVSQRPNPRECGGSIFLPQKGPAHRQAGVLLCTSSSFTLVREFHELTWMKLLYITLTDTRMCMHVPALPPGQSLESAEAPLSSCRKGRCQSWPTPSHVLVQVWSVVLTPGRDDTLPAKNMEYFSFQRFFGILWGV